MYILFKTLSVPAGQWESDITTGCKAAWSERELCMLHIDKNDDIAVLPLNARAIHCLHTDGCTTIEQLLDYTEEQLWKMRGVGVNTVTVIENCRNRIRQIDKQLYLQDKEQTQESSGKPTEWKILLDQNGDVVADLSVDELGLSNRAANNLHRNGLSSVYKLMNKTLDELKTIRNMGDKSANEVYQCLKQIQIVTISKDNGAISSLFTFDSLANDLAQYYDGRHLNWMREILRVHEKYPSIQGENFICALYTESMTRGAAKQKIFQVLDNSRQPLHYSKLVVQMPEHLNNTTILDEILIEMECSYLLRTEEDGEGACYIWRSYPCLHNCVDGLTECEYERVPTKTLDKRRKVLTMRLEGKTLEEVGKELDCTRERVRQIERDGLQNIREKHTRILEDSYLPFYETYNLTHEEFRAIFDVSEERLYALQILSGTTAEKRLPALEILSDESISLGLRRKADEVLHRDYIYLDGQWIRRNRIRLVEYYVSHFCAEETEYSDFIERFCTFVDSLPLSSAEKEKFQICSDDVGNGIANQLRNSNHILWAQNRMFRYYNMDAWDFTELMEIIDLGSYENVEISTLKFFREYADLMRRYDIHNEYELHNLLKKLWDGNNGEISFPRMPTIRIGSGSYACQVVELVQQEGPMTTEQVCTRFEELYGVKPETCLGSYLPQSDKIFCLDGIYRADCPPLPEAQQRRMKEVMRLDFYTIQETQELYHQEFPEESNTQLTPYQMKELGFTVHTGYNGYLTRDTYSSAKAFFERLLTEDNVVDLKRKHPALNTISTCNSVQYELRHSYDIVEFAPLKFINIRRLNDFGVTKADLRAYTEEVARFCPPGSYFTVKSLRQDGFSNEKLDALGFDEWFYSSLLRENELCFSAQRIGGTRIFLRGEKEASLGDMLTRLLEQTPEQKIEIYDLENLLQERYGIVLPRVKLIEIIRGTTMFYEADIMKTVYLDYDIYYEEV